MNLTTCFELLGSGLSFLGGVVLSWDALKGQRRIVSEEGINKLQGLLKEAGAPDAITFKGKPLTGANVQLLMSEKSLYRARLGLVLMTVGFLIDFVTKWFA